MAQIPLIPGARPRTLPIALCIGLLSLLPPLFQAQPTLPPNYQAAILHVRSLAMTRQFEQAVKEARPLLAALSRQFPPNDLNLLQLRLQFGFVLEHVGRLEEAETQFRTVLRFALQAGPPELLRDTNLRLLELMAIDGRHIEAREAAFGALEAQQHLSIDDPARSFILLYAGQNETAMGNNLSALHFLLEDQRFLASIPKNPDTPQMQVLALGALAQLYDKTGDEERVPALLATMRTLAYTNKEKAQLLQAETIHQVRTFLFAGQYQQAIDLWVLAMARDDTSAANMFSPYTTAKELSFLAQLNLYSGQIVPTQAAYRNAIAAYREAFASHFLFMTEAEKHQFLTDLQPTLYEFYSFCLLHQGEHPELADEAYRVALWQKTIVTDSLRVGQQIVAKTSSPDLAAAARSLNEMRANLAQHMRALNPDASFGTLQNNVNLAERELAAQLAQSGFGETTTLEQVRAALPAQDAAVEVVAFPASDGDGTTNRIVYAAIILRAGPAHPATMVRLGDVLDIEDSQKQLTTLAARSFSLPTGNLATLYSSLPWLGMEKLLAGARRIYLATDGVLDTTAFLAWIHSDGRYLLLHDEIDIRPVFSTAEFALLAQATDNKQAMLIGNPDFGSAPSSTGASQVVPLALTAAELDAVSLTLSQNGYSVRGPLERKQATKAALLAVAHPAILHVSTHGFFLPADTIGSDMDSVGLELSLQRSGLLLAGANLTLANQTAPDSRDNGVLTALEVSGLDLQGTQLVALSACETGLGQRGVSGEVLGLQRSFHIAGARRVMVSLWAVNDASTSDLMQAFYTNWLAKKEDPYQALRHAARTIYDTHPQPYFWAPFVLYGP